MSSLVAVPFAMWAGQSDEAASQGVEWTLAFTDDFNGSGLDENLWGRIGKGWNDWNRHMSVREDLVAVSGGQLHLHGVRNDDLKKDKRPMLTGGITTQGRFAMKYGKIELRCRFEAQKGAWPAIWMMPEDQTVKWPLCGEIDIVERLNTNDFVHQTVHSSWTKKHPKDPPYTARGKFDPDGWNVFGLEWTPDEIAWTVNGNVTHSYAKVGDDPLRYPWTKPFYLMVDMQLGGEWVGEVDLETLPVSMHVDWVKFYEGSARGVKFSEFVKQTAESGENAKLRLFVVGEKAFDPKGGHIQGIAASDDALYVAQMTRLVKLDWKGNVLAQRAVQSHAGDITWHDGELYTAVAVYPECKEGRIQVFDKDLNLLRETVIDRTIDGIAYADGVLYVGMGAKEQPSSKPHRVNIIGRFDAKTLKEIAPRAEFDYGHNTCYGFQDIVFDGERLIASFYAVKGSPDTVFFDKDLNILGTAFANCSQGFDILPPSLRRDGPRFVRAKTKNGKTGVSCSFDFIDLDKEKTCQMR